MSQAMNCFAVVVLLIVSQTAEATTAPARVVSANFYEVSSTDGPMTSTDIAGVPPSQYTVPTSIRVSNWNNLPLQPSDVPGSNLNLWDSHGHTTSVDVDWHGFEVDTGNWASPHTNGDSKMMNGTLQSDTIPGTKRVDIVVNDLADTFDIGVGYDVIIYADRDAHLEDQVFLVDDGINIVAPIPMVDILNPLGRAFDASTDYDEGTFDNAGNWLRFPGLTGGSFVISAEAHGNWPAFVTGFQIAGYHSPNVPPTPLGDLDGDGAYTGKDYLLWQQGFSAGIYTFNEVVEWQTHYRAPSPLGAVSVPEPNTVWLAAVAAVSCLTGVRRKPATIGY